MKTRTYLCTNKLIPHQKTYCKVVGNTHINQPRMILRTEFGTSNKTKLNVNYS